MLCEKKCKGCGKRFNADNSNQLYCSKECILKTEKQRRQTHRFKIFIRDNFTCIYCKRNIKEHKIKLEIDHLIPLNKKGSDKDNNLVTSCFECNRKKSDELLPKNIIEKIKNIIIINERRLRE